MIFGPALVVGGERSRSVADAAGTARQNTPEVSDCLLETTYTFNQFDGNMRFDDGGGTITSF
jgi:hypothetical protein